MELPPLLAVEHVMWICSVSKPKAYLIMDEPHRKKWANGGLKRIHRDSFLEQLESESKTMQETG